ncbi:hypothetical protein [Nocardia sp. NPDC060249]|uniref:hypothetical protein n=1 Tax=Nocardia sp. NPDC060249 TaxID=3347082 RepID=UPI0036618389
MSEILRVLAPDHPDLFGQIGRAVDFAGALRHANDSAAEGDQEEAWRLPAQLVDPALGCAGSHRAA